MMNEYQMKPQQYLDKITDAAQRGNHIEALDWSNQAINAYPNEAEFYYNRGVVKSSLGKEEEAIVDYGEAIKINPSYAKAYNNRGFSKSSLGKKEEAIEDYDEAIKINPRYVEVYNNRGSAKSLLKQYLDGIEDYDEAIKINPRYADVYNNRGNAKSSLGNYLDAIADYDKAIEINPNDADAYNNKGSAKLALGKEDEAIVNYDKAIEINPNDAEAYNNKGSAKLALGKEDEAIVNYDKAIEINPRYEKAYYNRGNAKHKLGRKEEAIADFDQAFASTLEKQNNALPDPTLLKFRPLNPHTLEALSSGQLYFSHPSHFNDPLDGNFLQTKMLGNSSLLEALDKIKICSFVGVQGKWEGFSEQEYLWWGHYADGHKGICLVYQKKIPVRTANYLGNMEYSSNLTTIDMGGVDGVIRTGFFSKHQSWNYEQEYRILVQQKAPNQDPKAGMLVETSSIGLQLQVVVFGMACKDEDIKLVRDILPKEKFPDQVFYRVDKEKQGEDNHYSLVKNKIR